MSRYIDHIGPGGRRTVVRHIWRVDLSQRLRWLYGSAHDRIKANAADVDAWRNLGRREAA